MTNDTIAMHHKLFENINCLKTMQHNHLILAKYKFNPAEMKLAKKQFCCFDSYTHYTVLLWFYKFDMILVYLLELPM